MNLATISDILSEDSVNAFIDSLPYSLRSTYGGNTTCVEVIANMGHTLILDCGTGLRELGNSMLQRGFGTGGQHASIYLSHTHWDHIQGLPFFVPIFIPDNKFSFYSIYDDLETRLRQQQDKRFFPVSMDQMPAQKEFFTIEPNEVSTIENQLEIIPKRMVHPGGSYGLRIQDKGSNKSFVFGSDAEFNINTIENIDQYQDFFDKADILVFDTQYTFDESLQKIDWGHSNSSIAVDIAVRFGVKKLILFHHDPSYDDKKIEELYIKAMRYRDMLPQKTNLEIIPAHEGLEFEL